MLRSSSFERSNMLLAVTLPPEGRADEEALAVCRRFRRRLAAVFWGLTAAMVPALFLPWISVVTLIGCLWLIAAIALPYGAFAAGNREMKALKRRRGWQTAGAGHTVAALPPAKPPRRLRTAWFVPPMVLSALPVLSVFLDDWGPAWNIVLASTAGVCLLVTALSLAFYPLVFRQRPDALDEDAALTEALTRVRRYNWTKFWLASSWCTALYSLAVWCCQGSMAWYFVWTAVYSIALVAAGLQTEFAARRAQRRLTLGRSEAPEVDEDDCWLFGLFYYNPDNAHFFVNERVGIGMSMNLAKPAAKWLMGLCVLLILALPLLGVWLMIEEFSPIELRMESGTVVSSQAFTAYRVDADDVESAALLDELPAASRIAGTGLETLLKGAFSVEGYGGATLCLNPQDPPFVVLKTADRTYLFGGDAAEEIYETLR